MAEFAVIGWGSLLWEPQILDRVGMLPHRWHNDGPVFPLEFSYISPNRLGALTLVIDGRGLPCRTYWIALDMTHWAEVEAELRRREGRIDGVDQGQVVTASPKEPGAIVAAWLNGRPYLNRAVWTSQISNFAEKTGHGFTVPRGIDYCENLAFTDPEAFEKARIYVHQTPPQTQTPFRTAFEARWPNRSQ